MKKKYAGFCLSKISSPKNWTWQELDWAIKRNIICKQDVINYAIKILNNGLKNFDLVLQLSIAEHYENIDSILEELMRSDEKKPEKCIEDKWRYAILLYLYIHKDIIKNVYEDIEIVYADFDYPPDMNGFIRYMPLENDKGIEENWKQYLYEKKKKYH